MPALAAYGLYLLLGLFVSAGMVVAAHPLGDGFLNWLREQAVKLPAFGGLSLEQIVKLDRWLANKLGKYHASIVGAGVSWLQGLRDYVYIVGYWSLYWPIGLFHTVTHLTTVTIPNMIRAKTAPIERKADAAEAQAKAAAGIAHALPKNAKARDRTKEVTVIQRVAMPHAEEWGWIHDHYGTLKKVVLGVVASAAGVALPHAPSLPVPWRDAIKGVRKRLGRVEALLGVSAFALMMTRVLRLPSPRCLTRGGVGKAARRLCGMDQSLLDSLLGDALAIAGLLSVVEFAEGLLAIEDEAVSILAAGIREFPG